MTTTREIVETLKTLVPLSTLPEQQLAELVKDVRIHRVPKNRVIFKRRQTHRLNLYLLEGSVDLCDEDYQVTPVKSGSFAAHQPLNPNQPPKCTGVTTSDSVLLSISKNRLDFALTWRQASAYGVMELTESPVEEEDEDDWMSALLQSNLFTDLPPTNIQKLFSRLQELPVAAGETVIRQGEEGGDSFYVVRSGLARVERQAPDGSTQTLAELEPGGYFGEEALISETTRNATVTMVTDGKLMYLTKSDFRTLVHEPVIHYLSREELEELRQQRDDVTLIDVRLAEECQLDENTDSINIPLPELRDQLTSLRKDALYVVCCDGGRRSEVGGHLLKEAGFNAYTLRGE